jgi:hypothetical protein
VKKLLALKGHDFRGCGKRIALKGHEFIRAANATKKARFPN